MTEDTDSTAAAPFGEQHLDVIANLEILTQLARYRPPRKNADRRTRRMLVEETIANRRLVRQAIEGRREADERQVGGVDS